MHLQYHDTDLCSNLKSGPVRCPQICAERNHMKMQHCLIQRGIYYSSLMTLDKLLRYPACSATPPAVNVLQPCMLATGCQSVQYPSETVVYASMAAQSWSFNLFAQFPHPLYPSFRLSCVLSSSSPCPPSVCSDGSDGSDGGDGLCSDFLTID